MPTTVHPKPHRLIADRPRHAARGWPAKGDRDGAVHVRLPLSRDALRSSGRGDDRQWPGGRSSIRPRPRKCPACERFSIARTSARSSARSPGPGFDGIIDERRPPFEDDVIRYYGQYVALAVADTFETAKAAADAVRVTYAKDKPNVETDLKRGRRSRRDCHHVRPAATACKASAATPTPLSPSAPVKLDQTYVTPAETHNPIELHATIAIWDGSTLTLYESTQGVVNQRGVLAQMFGLPKENVRVISKFLGSGFGGKLLPWTHSPLAAAAARQLGKPVKLVLSRKMMFQTVGHRAAHPAARAARRDARGQARLAAARLRLRHGRCSTTTTRIAARRRRSSTACPTSA